MQFIASEEYVELVEKARALLSPSAPRAGLDEIQFRAMRALVAELERQRYAVTARPQQRARATSTPAPPTPETHQARERVGEGRSSGKSALESESESARAAEPDPEPEHPAEHGQPRRRGRYVPAAVRRAVFARDQARCTFTSDSGQRCGETSELELHHSRAFARGGEHTEENLTLRCRAHNDFAAEKDFGRDSSNSRATRPSTSPGRRTRQHAATRELVSDNAATRRRALLGEAVVGPSASASDKYLSNGGMREKHSRRRLAIRQHSQAFFERWNRVPTASGESAWPSNRARSSTPRLFSRSADPRQLLSSSSTLSLTGARPSMKSETRGSVEARNSSAVPRDHAPAVDHGDAIADLERALHVVRDDDAGDVEPLCRPVIRWLTRAVLIGSRPGRRLVVQQDLGPHRDGARQADALAHAAGQIGRAISSMPGKPTRPSAQATRSLRSSCVILSRKCSSSP